MPLIKSAIKKLKQDKKKTKLNAKYRKGLKDTLKKMFKGGTSKNVKESYSAVDKAAKKKLIHKNKASRLKSRSAKLAKKK
jgi:small subunit ribosomal protein S20